MLSVVNLRKAFENNIAINDLSFQLPNDEITCLLAPSGAGKSTLTRILVGLEPATAGAVLLDGTTINCPDPRVILVPQVDSLFPHIRVDAQLQFGIHLAHNRARLNGADARVHLSRIKDQLGLNSFADRYPHQLSGGQRQRVALGRALAVQPGYLLCDEPFSALDELARQELRQVLRSIQSDFGQTILFVTHSVEEAAFVGDAVWLASGPPLQIHNRIPVPLGPQRSDDLLNSPAFTTFCHEIRKAHLSCLRGCHSDTSTRSDFFED